MAGISSTTALLSVAYPAATPSSLPAPTTSAMGPMTASGHGGQGRAQRQGQARRRVAEAGDAGDDQRAAADD